jgi:hypothetical protein
MMTLYESAFGCERIVRAAWRPETPAPMMAIVFFDDVDEVDLHLPILRKSEGLKERSKVLKMDVGFEDKRIVGD